MKKNDSKSDSLLEKIKKIYQSRNVKMTLFFGFYFFFFLFLLTNLDFNNTNNKQNKPNDDINNQTEIDKKMWQFNDLINNNYYYDYNVYEDELVITFNGYVNTSNSLINEYKYKYFLNIYNINQLIKNSKFLNKNIDDKDYKYSYQITNKTLGNILNNENLSEDLINDINIYTDNKLVVNKIELDLSNYMQEINQFAEYKVVLQYKEMVE